MVFRVREPLNYTITAYFWIMSEKTDAIENADPVGRFEDAMRELESVISQMEAGDLPLQRSLGLFEQGVSLARECRKSLDAAELRVKTLLEQQGDSNSEGARPDDFNGGPATDEP